MEFVKQVFYLLVGDSAEVVYYLLLFHLNYFAILCNCNNSVNLIFCCSHVGLFFFLIVADCACCLLFMALTEISKFSHTNWRRLTNYKDSDSSEYK